MKNREIFKDNFSFSNKISACYDQEARKFQKEYNRSHPGCHIWRHVLSRRTFFFCSHGHHFAASVEIVRFLFAHSNRTFTFYGSLFLPGSPFPVQFVQQALAESYDPCGSASSLVHPCTLRRWGSVSHAAPPQEPQTAQAVLPLPTQCMP